MRRRRKVTLWSAVRERPWLTAFIALVGVALGVVVGLLTRPDPPYVSTSSVVVQNPETTVGLNLGGDQRRFVSTQVAILRSDAVAAEAALRLRGGSWAEAETGDVRDAYQVTGDDATNVISVSFFADTEARAIEGANAVVGAYESVSAGGESAAATRAIERLDTLLDGLEQRIVALEQEIEAYLASIGDGQVSLGDLVNEATRELSLLRAEEAQAATPEDRLAIRAERDETAAWLGAFGASVDIAVNDPAYLRLLDEQAQIVDRVAALVALRDQVEIESQLSPSPLVFSSPASFAESAPGIGAFGAGLRGLVLGVIAGVGLAYAMVQRRRKIEDRFEPGELLGLPLLGDVSDFQKEGLDTLVPVIDAPRSAAAECFRFVGATVQTRAQGLSAQAITVVSSTLGQGKSVVAANTAYVLAQRGLKVAVIDVDFGNQQLTRLLTGDVGIEHFGLTDVIRAGVPLSRAIRTVESTGGRSIDLLSRGMQYEIAAEVLLPQTSEPVFKEMRRLYDIILLDAPPLLQVAYAGNVVSQSDAMLAVIKHGTSEDELADLADRMELLGVPVMGYVYNRAPLREEMTTSEGSMRDIIGDSGFVVDVAPRSK